MSIIVPTTIGQIPSTVCLTVYETRAVVSVIKGHNDQFLRPLVISCWLALEGDHALRNFFYTLSRIKAAMENEKNCDRELREMSGRRFPDIDLDPGCQYSSHGHDGGRLQVTVEWRRSVGSKGTKYNVLRERNRIGEQFGFQVLDLMLHQKRIEAHCP